MIVSPWYPVPPTGYGGIELMAYLLASELQRRGHQVSVIGQQGSKGPFETIAIAPESWSSQLGTRDQLPRESLFLYRAYELVRRRAFDVVHDHSGLTGILMAASTRLQTPVVATLHGDLTEAEGEFLAAIDHHVHLVAISRAQQALVAGVDWRRIVYNAVDPADYTPITQPDQKHNYVLQLARISPTKGQHIAIEVARRIGMHLVLAGKVDNDSTEYFEREVFPVLTPLAFMPSQSPCNLSSTTDTYTYVDKGLPAHARYSYRIQLVGQPCGERNTYYDSEANATTSIGALERRLYLPIFVR